MEAVGTSYIYMLYDSIIIHIMIYIYIRIYILWYMCQICERVTLARLSCPERSRPKDGVSPIVVVVPVAELAACSDGKLSHGWCWCATSGERNNIVQLQLDHVSCTELLSLSMWLRCDILNWWWRHVKTIGTTSGSYWLKNRRVGDSTSDLAWPGRVAYCWMLQAPRSQVPGPRRGRLEEKVEATQAEGAQILNEARHLQHFPNTVLLDLWYYWYLWCSEIASKSTQKRKKH